MGVVKFVELFRLLKRTKQEKIKLSKYCKRINNSNEHCRQLWNMDRGSKFWNNLIGMLFIMIIKKIYDTVGDGKK